MHRTAQTATVEARPILLDLAHLSQQTADDLQLQRELLELFKLQSPELIARMRALTWKQPSAESQPVLCDLVHQLKGSALAIGAFPLAAAAAAAERTLAESTGSNTPESDEAVFSALAAVLARSLAAIDDYISKLEI